MTFTIDLPEELASRLSTALPEEERSQFAVAAIEEALEAHLQDEAECVAAVEEAIAEIEAGRTGLSFEPIKRAAVTESGTRLAQWAYTRMSDTEDKDENPRTYVLRITERAAT